MSKGGGKTNTQTIQTSEPWAGQKPYLEHIFARAGDLSNVPRQYFPGSTVVGMDPRTQEALSMMEGRARAGSPMVDAAQGEFGKILGGEYLNQDNPAMAAMGDRLFGDIRSRVDSSFGGAGRSGSAGHAEAMARGYGDAMAPIAYQNYANERGRMFDAARLSPALAQADYADADRLAGVGAQHEDLAGRNIQDQMGRWDFAQNEPWRRLGDFAGLVQGNYGGTQTTTQPLYRNQGAGALGGAAMGAGLGQMLGMSNPWLMALGGGLAGLL